MLPAIQGKLNLYILLSLGPKVESYKSNVNGKLFSKRGDYIIDILHALTCKLAIRSVYCASTTHTRVSHILKY